jgi:hypothetical protein
MDRAIDDPPNVGNMARQAVSDVIGLRLEYDKACAELLLGANADDDKRRQDLAKLSKAATEESTVDLLRVGDLWRTRRLFPKTSPPSSLRGLRCARAHRTGTSQSRQSRRPDGGPQEEHWRSPWKAQGESWRTTGGTCHEHLVVFLNEKCPRPA